MGAMARSSTTDADIGIPHRGAVRRAKDARSLVMAALGELVESGKAEWSRGATGEIELRLLSGEVFLLGKVAVIRIA
ncbi:hypothetical protein FJ986_11255 [Mesorhizobium sp. B1-1-1]|uniref:hypothetical protein n=1 Tax=Mesorhizobium sp. B1-1-1 TaxID=2589983 RepID=UPI0011274F0F|nr:hypothetical protein [Mesorhizobium sp. B1-1-1]TPN67182.1 hypothetical protein FJ986_11255 [Mesorhizobium sp. B1-1-1]